MFTTLTGPLDFPNIQTNGFAANNYTLNGGADLAGTALQLTEGNTYEARSAWSLNPVPIGSFTTAFQWTYGSNPTADGFTFAVQDAGNTALGGDGGYLGYGGIAGTSFAAEFNLFSGVSTFGVGLNGAITPSIDLTAYGINFHANSQDVFQATLSDNGAGTLTVSLWDKTQNPTTTPNYTQTFTVPVMATSYVGFTGATGLYSSVQNILNWTYQSGATNINYSNGFDDLA